MLFEQYNLGQNDTDVVSCRNFFNSDYQISSFDTLQMITDDNLTGLRENRDGNNGLSDSHIPIRTLKAEQQDGLIQFPTEDQISVKPETQGPVWSNATCDSELLMF